MTARARRIALLVLMGALTILVAVDHFAAPGVASAPREAAALGSEAALTARVVAEAASLDGWRDARSSAERAWTDARRRMIAAGSADIAYARLRELVLAAMTDLGLTLDASSALPPAAPLEGEPLRVVGVRIECSSPAAAPIHALIDRIENLPEATAHVEALRIVGPGRAGRPAASVTIDIRALAWIEPEA